MSQLVDPIRWTNTRDYTFYLQKLNRILFFSVYFRLEQGQVVESLACPCRHSFYAQGNSVIRGPTVFKFYIGTDLNETGTNLKEPGNRTHLPMNDDSPTCICLFEAVWSMMPSQWVRASTEQRRATTLAMVLKIGWWFAVHLIMSWQLERGLSGVVVSRRAQGEGRAAGCPRGLREMR